MIITRRKLFADTVLDNLLDAQKNMASAEKVDAKGLILKVDAKGLILLSRFILHLLKKMDDEIIHLSSEAKEKRSQPPVNDLDNFYG